MTKKRDTFTPDGNDITIRFGCKAAAQHFKLWLCGAGEQEYWEWMRYREAEEPGDITATRFNYHEPGGGVIDTVCGRMDPDWRGDDHER